MDKATPTPASVDSVMALFVTAANARASWMETGFNRADAEQAEASLRAEVERLAAQAASAPAVRMLTREELNDVALSEQVGWGPGEYVEAVQLALLRVNAGRTIPADGVIGGAA